MPTIHVCALSKIADEVRATGARALVTLINSQTPVPRPAEIAPGRHLSISMSDITAPLDGHIMPGDTHIDQFLAFVRGWDRAAPMLIHCYAGVSRSTAGAFIAACALNPGRPEAEIARTIRARSPTASPNPLMVALADRVLARQGRMVAAVEAIGRGEDCFEGVPFKLELA